MEHLTQFFEYMAMLLSGRRNETHDPRIVIGTSRRPKTTSNFLFHFDMTQISFGLIVRKRHLWGEGKRQHCRLVYHQAFKEISAFRSFQFAFLVPTIWWRFFSLSIRTNVIELLTPSVSVCHAGCPLGRMPIQRHQQPVHQRRPSPSLFGDRREFSQEVSPTQGVATG